MKVFEKSWEYAKDVRACFVDLEQAYVRVLRNKLRRMLQEGGIDGHLLMSIHSIVYYQPRICVCLNNKQPKPFHVGVRHRQRNVLSLLLYIDFMVKFSRTGECVTNGRYMISRLLFANDFVLLASSESGLQLALNGFAAACDILMLPNV